MKGEIFNRVSAQMSASVDVIANAGISGGSVTKHVSSYNVSGAAGTGDFNLNYSGKKGLDLSKGAKSVAQIHTDVMEKGRIELTGWARDEITPEIINLEMWLDGPASKRLADAFEKALPSKIKKTYSNRNQGQWADNTPIWKQMKAAKGQDTRPMHQHDAHGMSKYGGPPLADTVAGFGNKMKVKQQSKDIFTLEGLTEEFEQNPYVWVHETGFTARGFLPYPVEVPARPFVGPAMNEAMAQAARSVLARSPWEFSKVGLTRPMEYSIGTSTSWAEFQSQSTMSMDRFLMMLWWFLPQVQEYQYLGYLHDVKGYLSGHFASVDTMKHFGSALLMGKTGQLTGMPTTAKLARRQARKSLWGVQTVSLTGAV